MEKELSAEQDADAYPQHLPLLAEVVVLVDQAVGQLHGGGDDFVLAGFGCDFSHWLLGVVVAVTFELFHISSSARLLASMPPVRLLRRNTAPMARKKDP